MKFFFILTLFFSLCGCVSLDQNIVETGHPHQFFLKDPSCQVKIHETVHFLVKACDSQTAQHYADLAERFYDRIMQDTDLYSFVPANPYEIRIYPDKSEYISISRAQDWSRGLTVGNMILTYPSSSDTALMSHEITHLILNEFMGDHTLPHFVSEGLAVYQERQASAEADSYYREIINKHVKPSPIPFIEMMSFMPASDNRSAYVSKWYAQCSSVIDYLIKRGGTFKFSILIKDMRRGYSFESALKDAYSGLFVDYRDLEKKWLSWL